MRTRHPIAPRRPAHGLVLVIALILMAVIGVSSAAAIRLALTGSIISMGLRANSEATQAAEAGLRWCERETRANASQLVANDPSFILRASTSSSGEADLWRTSFQANAITVPRTVMASAGLVNISQLPQCVAELDQSLGRATRALSNYSSSGANAQTRIFVVTVRGFSADYRRGAQGEDSGAEVWLQSNMRWVR